MQDGDKLAGKSGVRGRHASMLAAALVALAASAHPGPAAHAGDDALSAPDTLTGDWGGARNRLSDAGIDWRLTYTGEVFANVSGGLDRGFAYQDLIDFEVDADLDRLFGWTGGRAHVSLFQIDDGGRNAGDLVGSVSDISNIDARPTFRLFTLYVEQALGQAGSLRIGQIAADDEFVISETAANLVNGAFGWANFADDNLPGGGPAYPLAAPGLRLALDPSEKVKMLGAVFSGDPAGDCPRHEDPEVCNAHGTTFSFTGGALFMGEVQYRPDAKPDDDRNVREGRGGDRDPPETAYKVGGWYHNDDFVDLGNPVEERTGNWLVYGIVDQTVWRNETSALTLFLRGAVAPEDRNPIAFYVDAGFGLTAPFAARPNDMLAFGVAYSEISNDLAAHGQAGQRAAGLNRPVQDGETALELTYIARITPWWSLQPDLQYIHHPGGNVPDPNNPARAVEDAFLVGLRTDITF